MHLINWPGTVFKIEIRNRGTYSPEVSVSSIMAAGLLFGDQDKKKIEKRKKYLEDLWRER